MGYENEMKAVFESLDAVLQARLLKLGKTLLAASPKRHASSAALLPGARRNALLYLVENPINKQSVCLVPDAVKRKQP